ncbi:DUF5694 domain-containing protein [Planomicrobium sp. Y74]|uniref:DUF5694 domain-containing protein n=1 Tax=Planomicrobium sp. Y74 TaxID=2478977 RepID=UPI000EF4FC8C|nr:DUF5694 domain-containing protein [Planomicrobium sp. Y74]RLQ90044.1 hypothetical protein D9754_09855 [Planomicrobium sp. Y74]
MEPIGEIVLVGTYHFVQQEETLTNKEEEILKLVDLLAELKPSKVAVEWEKSAHEDLNAEYTKSPEEYSMNEIEQIGFRLASQLNHEEIFAINWSGHLTQEDMILLNQSIQTDHPAVLRVIENYSTPSISSGVSLIESYRELNNKEKNAELEKMYLSFLSVVHNGQNIGHTFLSKWVERELMIVKNVFDIVEKPEERVLLLVGGDHLWMLTKLFEGKGWKVINPFES